MLMLYKNKTQTQVLLRSAKKAALLCQKKVRLIKATVFPVVRYGCESWTIKKAETEALMILNCGVGEDS